jgi:phosphoglucomutase
MLASQRTVMIRFSTSGWRGIVGQEFTFRNVRLVLDATVAVLRARGGLRQALVSYDTRLLSEKFAHEAVNVLTHNGVAAVLSERDLPTPCLAFATREVGADLGVVFTGSHNSAEYNGVKLYTRDGAPAGRDLLGAIEDEVDRRGERFDDFFVPERQLASRAPLADGYLRSLESDIDWDAIRKSGLSVAVDPLFGTSREFLDRVLLANGVPTFAVHTTKDPYFGGYAPECTPGNLARLRERVRSSGAMLGLATDGDADRFGIIDGACRPVPANLAIALLVDYLLRRRSVTGGVGRTVGTTRLIDRVAAAAGSELVETKVGFYHFAPMLLSGRLAIATEESAGLGVGSHLPERDGIYAALLVAEMVAVEGCTVAELVRRLFARFGTLISRRIQLPLTERMRAAVAALSARSFSTFAGLKVLRDDRSDGLLLELEGGGWVLLRAARTEPKLRVYAEATSSRQLRELVRAARRLVNELEEARSHV